MIAREVEKKLDRMRDIIRSLKRVVVAFSAGVDSTFVLKVALDTLGTGNVIAATGKSPSLATAEFDETAELARWFGVEHVIFETDEFSDPNYLSNPNNRCYFCKTHLYETLQPFVVERGFNAIINGINADDLGDWRPGIKAADERDVRSPAAEAGLTKADIRVLSESMRLPTHDKPAAPCLSSRVQYGESITTEKLRMIESCERLLHELGFRECRVRHHQSLARIEVPPDVIGKLADEPTRRLIDEHFRAAGYQYVTLDLRGFRSGSMNEVISIGLPSSKLPTLDSD